MSLNAPGKKILIVNRVSYEQHTIFFKRVSLRGASFLMDGTHCTGTDTEGSYC